MFNKEKQSENNIFSLDNTKLNENCQKIVQDAVSELDIVGFMTGYYDENLTITQVSSHMLKNLGYTFEEFQKKTSGSLRNLFYGENQTFLEYDRFQCLQGCGEGQMLMSDGTPVFVRMCKKDAIADDGKQVWVLSVQIDWMQQNLKLINNVIHSAMWRFDCDKSGNIKEVYWSHEFRTMLGYHDILDFPNKLESWSDLLHPEDREATLTLLEQAIQDKTDSVKYDCEYRLKMKNGSYQWFRANAETTRRLDGTVRLIVGTFINIDKRKQSEMKAQRNEAFHRAYTEGNICEYYVNLKDNSFESLKVEDSLLEIFEKSHTWDELIQAYLDNYVVDEDKEAVSHFYNRNFIVEKLSEGSKEITLECRIRIKGEECWVRNVLMRGEENDGSRYAMIFVRDITEARKEMENILELTRKNDAMDLLLQGTMRLVNRFAMCNLEDDTYKFYSLHGKKPPYDAYGTYHDLIRRIASRYKVVAKDETIDKVISADHIRGMIRSMDDIYKLEYCTEDEKHFKSMAFIPLSWKDGVLEKVLLIAQDTTQEKLAEIESRIALKEAYEAANKANRSKTEFLSNMSHDIRTPMNAIVGMTAIAGANIDHPDRVIDCLGKITKSSRHLLGLINEVLDMSRIENGKIELTEEDFNLAELVDNLLAMTRSEIDAHHHNFEVQLNKIEHEYVRGDSLRVQQIFTNIMSNAIKYTPDGGNILFSITEKPTTSLDIGCYEFVIQDNGMGMSEEFQKVMFDPFTRADDKRISEIQGTGLGMAITRNIVNMMNGNIKVESKLGKGSRFTVTIFLRLRDEKSETIDELVNLPVLVVDDDKICCEGTVATLNEIGIDGEWVLSGKEAVERAVKRHENGNDYFVYIIDWQMPGMDGIETTRQIRQKIGPDVSVIVLTSYDYTKIEEEAKAAGVDEFISKPLFRSRLTAALQNIISGKPSQDARDYLKNIAASDYTGKRILLVEDNELNREVAAEIIGMTGAEIETAVNGKEAVDKVADHPNGYYDLVIMDVQMPIMNGYEAATAIRSLPKHKGDMLPIIAMTANAFTEDVILAKSAGMNEHIAKPLDMEKLNRILHEWM